MTSSSVTHEDLLNILAKNGEIMRTAKESVLKNGDTVQKTQGYALKNRESIRVVEKKLESFEEKLEDTDARLKNIGEKLDKHLIFFDTFVAHLKNFQSQLICLTTKPEPHTAAPPTSDAAKSDSEKKSEKSDTCYGSFDL